MGRLMNRCPSRQQLEQYLDEQLSDSERVRLEGHIGGCRSCQQQLEEAASFGESRALRALHAGHPAHSHEPKAELLRRIAQAALPRSERQSASDVVVQVTSTYVSPEPLPRVSGVDPPSDVPTLRSPRSGSEEGHVLQELAPGTILGQYRILDQLGAGGMGQVYKAVHIAMDRVVALKVIAPHLLRDARAR